MALIAVLRYSSFEYASESLIDTCGFWKLFDRGPLSGPFHGIAEIPVHPSFRLFRSCTSVGALKEVTYFMINSFGQGFVCNSFRTRFSSLLSDDTHSSRCGIPTQLPTRSTCEPRIRPLAPRLPNETPRNSQIESPGSRFSTVPWTKWPSPLAPGLPRKQLIVN